LQDLLQPSRYSVLFFKNIFVSSTKHQPDTDLEVAECGADIGGGKSKIKANTTFLKNFLLNG